MDDVVREFLLESREGTDQMEVDLVALEREPSDHQIVVRLFRVIHTIKGTCGFFGLAGLQAITHAAESLLAQLRDEGRAATPEIVSALLGTLDAVRRVLASLEASDGEREGEVDAAGLVARLTRLQERPAAAPPPVPPAAEAPAAADLGPGGAVSDSHVRVDVALLDDVMNLVGELVLLRNQLLQSAASGDEAALTAMSQKLNHVTSELQADVLKTRMQPLAGVWSKFPRVVRDLAAALGKQVRLVLEGQETELDRTLVDAIRDPLTHMVRNAIDHGLESPEARAAAGKPREGTLVLRARHQAGQVMIEIADDGAGIDLEKVKAKAVARGLTTPEAARRMSDRDAAELIFHPGLSTAETVTALSGRGVGMDVVRSNIRRINGSIDIETRAGQGTSFRIRLPLTLAILPALVVGCREQRFVIPQASLVELLRLGGDAGSRVELFHGTPVFRLRNRLCPVVDLARELGLSEAAGRERLTLLVLQVGDEKLGLVVDRVEDAYEIVVKPLDKQLAGLALFGGATILSDGTVALIVDVEGLAKHARVLQGDRAGREAASPEERRPRRAAVPTHPVIVCRCSEDGRVAIPTALVTRLEQFPAGALERLGALDVVQYRGKILPLLRVSDFLDERRARPRAQPKPGVPDVVRVIVHGAGDDEVGLVVDEIIDIADVPTGVERPGSRRFVLGSRVVDGRATELLDVGTLIRQAHLRPEAAG